MPIVHQKHALSARWVALTNTFKDSLPVGARYTKAIEILLEGLEEYNRQVEELRKKFEKG